jgi:hypothetical protein
MGDMRQEEISRFEQAALAEVFADDLAHGTIPSDADMREALGRLRAHVPMEAGRAG